MLLTILNSKSDQNGNRYWAVELSNFGDVLAQGTMGCDNINTSQVMQLGCEVCREELPIREFNRLTKKYDYIGSNWDDIKKRLFME